MLAVRRLLARRYLAALLCAAALMLKLLVPAGYMIGRDHGRVTIELCSGVSGRPAMAAMHGDTGLHGGAAGHGKADNHKAELPCAFAGLSAAALSAIDPVQLAALIAFVTAVGAPAPVLPTILGHAHLRPPPRGPPAPR